MVETVLVSYLPVKGITWTAIGIHKSLRLPVELRLTKASIQSFVYSINYRCECNKKFSTVTVYRHVKSAHWVSSNGRGFATHKYEEHGHDYSSSPEPPISRLEHTRPSPSRLWLPHLDNTERPAPHSICGPSALQIWPLGQQHVQGSGRAALKH